MAELSKEAKLILLCDAILGFTFFVFFFLIPDIYNELGDFGDVEPSIYAVGLTCLVFGIFLALSIKINEFEKIKIAWEMGMVWLAGFTILNIYSVFAVPGEVWLNAMHLFNIILGLVYVIVNLFIYQRELKNQ